MTTAGMASLSLGCIGSYKKVSYKFAGDSVFSETKIHKSPQVADKPPLAKKIKF